MQVDWRQGARALVARRQGQQDRLRAVDACGGAGFLGKCMEDAGLDVVLSFDHMPRMPRRTVRRGEDRSCVEA